MKRNFVITLLVAFSTISQAQKLIGPKEELDIILQNIEQFSQFVMNAEYEKIANAYTVDGKIMPSGPAIIEGREAIQKRWTLPEGVGITYHKIMPEEIRVVGDYAHDYGYYEGVTKRADGSEASWKGKYVIVWQKIDEQWKIYLDIWNRVE